MLDKKFLDSNVILYALGDELSKKKIAQDLLEQKPILSTQVLTEVSQVCLKKFKLDPDLVSQWIELLQTKTQIISVTSEMIQSAIKLFDRYQYSFYDSLIIAASLHAKVDILYSEDLQNGQCIEGLRIINPFIA